MNPSPPPPPLLPPSGRPPASPPARSPTSDSSRADGAGSPVARRASPPQRPRMIRTDSAGSYSRGGGTNFQHGTRPSGRDRPPGGGGGDLRGSVRRGGPGRDRLPQVWFDEGSYGTAVGSRGSQQPPVAATDRTLLMASLDHEAVEDEAEATLLDVLERHQVSNQGISSGGHVRHRRNRSNMTSATDFNFLNLGGGAPMMGSMQQAQRPASAPSSGEAAQPFVKPPLHRRGISHGRSAKGFLVGVQPSLGSAATGSSWAFDSEGGPPPHSFADDPAKPPPHRRGVSHGRSNKSLQSSLVGIATGANWAFDSEGGLLESFSDEDPPEGAETNAAGPKGSANQAPSQEGAGMDAFFSTLAETPLLSNRGGGGRHHKRIRSVLPLGLERDVSESSRSSGPTGLTTPGERARHVAFKMKMLAANSGGGNAEDLAPTGGGGGGEALHDMLNAIEAHRDGDDRSGGSARGSRSGGGSRSGTSGASANASRGGSSGPSGGGGKRGHRPSSNRRGGAFSGFHSSPFATTTADRGFTTAMDSLFQIAEHVQELHQIPEELYRIPEGGEGEGEEVGEGGARGSDDLEELNAMNTDFLSQIRESHPDIPEIPDYPDETEGGAPGGRAPGGAVESTPMLPRNARPSLNRKRHVWSVTRPPPALGARYYNFVLWWREVQKQATILAVAFDAPFVRERLRAFCRDGVLTLVAPALAASAFLYYRLNTPFLPIGSTGASISWWILFMIRHFLTLQMAYVTEYVFVEVLAMKSRLCVQMIGPLPTLYIINAKGWPYIVTWWGVFNLLLNQDGHGDEGNPFFNNWLSFTGIEMFTAENPSGGVVQSLAYKEILVSMIVVGVATSLKSTFLALYFGKRVYIHYKPKLEKIMEAMILLTEVADLGDAIDDMEFEKVDRQQIETDKEYESRRSISSSRHNSNQLRDTIRTSVMNDVIQRPKAGNPETDSDEDVNMEIENKGSTDSQWNRFRTGTGDSFDGTDSLNQASSQESPDKVTPKVRDDEIRIGPQFAARRDDFLVGETTAAAGEPPVAAVEEPVRGLLRNRSTTTHIRALLDDWEEPFNKSDETADPTIHDILVFRNALQLLEDAEPFGSSFGPAVTRDSCIRSSKGLYKRLLSLSPGSAVLHFDIIGVLAYNVDGTFDDKKARNLVRLFRPDKFDEVSLLHFVQSCDGIFKKIRYLRASVGNSSLIDSVLESMINVAFGFFLALTVMSILHLNPWTLLVSMSTVLVSFAFALGPSAAKLIEGMIMIAVRRPFDLGDRISIVDCTGAPDNSDDPGYHDTWIVEDCTLFTTTLRLSRTNEVSTVNNGSIANTRIVNHGRSQNALVNVPLAMRIDATHDQVMIVKSALEQYIHDNPRVWASLVNCRIVKIDPANELIMFSARIQHVKSWQDLLPILQARGELEKFCTEIMIKLDIYYDGSASKNDVYIKELPEQQVFPEEALPVSDVSVPGVPPEHLHAD